MKFEFEYYDDIKNLLLQIGFCEGRCRQQVSFSTYHKALTQVCFDCKKVRSMINVEDNSLHKVGEKGNRSSDGVNPSGGTLKSEEQSEPREKRTTGAIKRRKRNANRKNINTN